MRLSCFALFAFAASAMAGTPATPAMDYDAALALARKDEASLSPADALALLAAQEARGGKALADCRTASGGVLATLSPFTVVLELDAKGRVVHTWREGDSSIALCFETAMQAQTLVAPPRAPFLTYFAMRWDD